MSYVRAPSRETAASPGPGQDQAASFVRELNGQDFSPRAGSPDNHPPFRFAETEIHNHVDPLAAANRARVLSARELRHLFILFAAPVVWLIKAVGRWNERQALRWRLQELPDHMLKDIGISRDQIDAVVSGSLKRGTRR